MATYLWSSLAHRAEIQNFDPAVDVFRIDYADVSAFDLLVDWAKATSTSTTWTAFVDGVWKEVTIGIPLQAFTKSSITFQDGSQIVMGDDTTGVVNDDQSNLMTGSAGDDHFFGWGGDD